MDNIFDTKFHELRERLLPELGDGARLAGYEVSSIQTISKMIAELLVDLSQVAEKVKAKRFSDDIVEFYVLLQKIKSILGGKPMVFSEQDTAQMLEQIEDVVVLSRHSKDTETMLTATDIYLDESLELFRPGRQGLMKILKSKGLKDYKDLKSYISGKMFLAMFENISQTLLKYVSETMQDDEATIYEFSQSRIYSGFNTIIDFIDQEEQEITAEATQRLRVLCKRLRYSIAMFGDYADIKKLNKGVEELKDMLDFLGYYNDLTIQFSLLETYIDKLEKAELGALSSVMTIIFAVRSELYEVILRRYSSLYTEERIFGIKRKRVRRYFEDKLV